MKLSRLSVAFLGAINLILSVNVFALGWEECKHLYRELTPEQAAACNANNQSCLVNNFQYTQCRNTNPSPIEYVTIDGSGAQLATSVASIGWRNVIVQKNIANNHVFSWPSRKGNVRLEYAFRSNNNDPLNWNAIGVYSPGITYTIINYLTYVPTNAIWYPSVVCNPFERAKPRPIDANLFFRVRVEDPDGNIFESSRPKSDWRYVDGVNFFYGSDKECRPLIMGR